MLRNTFAGFTLKLRISAVRRTFVVLFVETELAMKGFVLSLCASLAIGLTGTASTADAGGGHHHHNYRYPTYRPVYPVVVYPNQFFFNPYGGYYFPQPLPPVIFYNRY